MDRVHAEAMERVGEGILRAAQEEEKKLDAQLKKFENLGKNCPVPLLVPVRL